MIQLLHDTHFDFMKYRKYFYAFSLALMLAIVAWLVVNGGPRYSVDFTGGTLIQIQTAKPMQAADVRRAVQAPGFGGAELQSSGNGDEFLIRIGTQDATDVTPDPPRAPRVKVFRRRRTGGVGV